MAFLLLFLCILTGSSSAPSEEIQIHPRIVGGHDATKGSYPWQVSIRVNGIPTLSEHGCGGSIIADQWILTAAHCICVVNCSYQIIKELSVVAGEHDLTIEEGTEQQFDIEKIMLHENYSVVITPFESFYDVALMKIKGRFMYNRYVQPILMATPQQDDLIDGNSEMYYVASGWGSLQYGEPLPAILQESAMPLVPLQACKESVDNLGMKVHDDMICAGHLVKKIGVCNGDSGGPLACLVDKQWTLAGVASWVPGYYMCARLGYPDIFTRVANRLIYNWIVNIIDSTP